MKEIEVACIRKKPKLLASGLYREVFGLGNVVLKVQKDKDRSLKRLRARAVEADARNRRLRGELDFLPKYYGTVLTAVRTGATSRPAVVTFHEYVTPLSLYSLQTLKSMLAVMEKAVSKGYIPDMKYTNFGKKKGKLYYLDEYGVGKSPIPPDVMEDFNRFLQPILDKLKAEVRLARKRMEI
jgi:hypothetical protein